jgi:hypothetical protein
MRSEVLKLWRAQSSGTWRRGVWCKFTDTSEQRTASIFRRLCLLILNVMLSLLLDQEDGRQYIPPKCWQSSTRRDPNSWEHIFQMLRTYLLASNTGCMSSWRIRIRVTLCNVTHKQCTSKHKQSYRVSFHFRNSVMLQEQSRFYS